MKLTKKLNILLAHKPDAPCKIWSGEWLMWWCADAKGYTSDCTKAGVYTITEAVERTYHCGKEKRIKIIPLLCFDIKVAQNYLSYHPKAGTPTGFEQAILTDTKIHTIRLNHEAWAKKAEKINAGLAYLSLSKWSGLPYRSKVVEIKRLFRVGVQSIRFYIENKQLVASQTRIDGKGNDELLFSERHLYSISHNDGFENLRNFNDWFKNEPFKGAIIHFTDFRY